MIDKDDKNKVIDNTTATTSDATSADNTSYATPPTSPATQQYANGLIDYLGELKRERDRLNNTYNADDEEAEKKRMYRNNLIASIGDGISAIARIASANRYAPTPDTKTATPLSDAYNKRYNDYIARRDKARAAYQNAMLNLNNRDYTARKALMDLAQKDKNLQSLINRRNAQNENDRTKANAYVKTQETQQGLNEARKVTEEGKPAVQKSQIELNQKRGNAAITTANAATTRAAKAGSGKGGGKGATAKYPVFGRDGSVVGHVYTKDEAVSETERRGGTYPKSETITKYDVDEYGKHSGSKSTKTYTAGRKPVAATRPSGKVKKVIKGFNGHK